MKKIDRVIFDCDSTLTSVEGVDELARRKGVYEDVSKLTDLAMEGKLDFLTALRQRLELIRPNKQDLMELGKIYIDAMVEGVPDAIQYLADEGIQTGIVSGGFKPAVDELARHIGISADDVFANEIFFTTDGTYDGFAEDCPTAQESGKAIVAGRLDGCKLMIGDGMSDFQARSQVFAFVAFTGVRRRPAVVSHADYELDDFHKFPALLKRIKESLNKELQHERA